MSQPQPVTWAAADDLVTLLSLVKVPPSLLPSMSIQGSAAMVEFGLTMTELTVLLFPIWPGVIVANHSELCVQSINHSISSLMCTSADQLLITATSYIAHVTVTAPISWYQCPLIACCSQHKRVLTRTMSSSAHSRLDFITTVAKRHRQWR